MVLKRYSDWPTRLDEFLRSNGQRKFEYGEWDCCMFVCEAINAMTGVHPGMRLRGKYSTALGAVRAVRKIVQSKDRDIVKLIVEDTTQLYGMKEVPIALAGRGCVVMLQQSKHRNSTLGLLSLDGKTAIVVCADRLASVRIRPEHSARAWMVG